MNVLVYNAGGLRYEIAAKPISDLDKEKVCLIEDINKIQKALGKGPLTPEQFNAFMTMKPIDLELIVHDQQAVLNTDRYKAAS